MGGMTIGQLTGHAGVDPRTLRYYERIGMLARSSRTEAGNRVYTCAEADRLAFIRRAEATRLSLAKIEDIIASEVGGDWMRKIGASFLTTATVVSGLQRAESGLPSSGPPAGFVAHLVFGPGVAVIAEVLCRSGRNAGTR